MSQPLASSVNIRTLNKLSFIHHELGIKENFFKWIDDSIIIYAAANKIFNIQIKAEPNKHLDLLADWLGNVNNISTREVIT